jgi:protein-tyrosine-phosphatase
MAAALLQRLLGEAARVESAGIDTGEGLRPTKEAVSVMKELGVDVSAHRSRNAESLDLKKFDRVLAMTPAISNQLREAGVDVARITQLNVSDPYCKGTDVYREAAKEIESQLRSLFDASHGEPFLK